MSELSDLQSDLQDVVGLIDTYGADITLNGKTNVSFNPATSQAVINDDGTKAFKGIIEDMGGTVFGGNLVQTGDKKITTAASNFDSKPNIGDTVEWGEGKFGLLNAVPTMVGGMALLYELHARQ